jgi:hypothetical protein
MPIVRSACLSKSVDFFGLRVCNEQLISPLKWANRSERVLAGALESYTGLKYEEEGCFMKRGTGR